MDEKQRLREKLRAARRKHVAGLPESVMALLFKRPPAPIVAMLGDAPVIGLYHAEHAEAPCHGYARWFHENGTSIALPWFADRQTDMAFRLWADPYAEDGLEAGPFGIMQPKTDAPLVTPAALFAPLVGFTPRGDRLGQGGGHYDRWLAAHSATTAVGLGWDCQCVDSLPAEPHDVRLRAVVTPGRLYEGVM